MAHITRIAVNPLRIPLKKPFVTSLGAQHHAENIVVRLWTDGVAMGTGECSPYPPINGETQGTGMAVAPLLARALLGRDALDITGALAAMDQVIHGNTSIKSAFDIALHDIAAQQAGLPLYRFLGGTTKRTLYTDYTVSIGAPEQMAADAVVIKEAGYPTIKVKVGGDGDTDIARIQAIRAAVGSAIPLRLDANQGWDPDTAIHVLQALGGLGIEHCEEPIARWRWEELPRIRQASPIPIMADESCFFRHDAERLTRIGACQRVNIKLGKSGGLYEAGRVLEAIRAAGLQAQLGGFVESRIGFTAAAHLALAHEVVKWCDMDTPLMFKEDPVVGGMVFGEGGSITVPEVPGIGAVVREELLGEGITLEEAKHPLP
jgi:L-alanine-DL-glutamate epimerase-like enolase superfamily enzyme